MKPVGRQNTTGREREKRERKTVIEREAERKKERMKIEREEKTERGRKMDREGGGQRANKVSQEF